MRPGAPLLTRLALATWTSVVALSSACAAPSHPAAAPQTLPTAPVVTLEGRSTDLPTVLQGHVALVSFWATWCTACDREIDALNRLSARTVADDALVVGVAVGESRETVDAFVRRRGLRYTQVLDEDFRLADALGQRDVPATLVVDRTGRIVYRGDALDGAGLAAFSEALARR